MLFIWFFGFGMTQNVIYFCWLGLIQHKFTLVFKIVNLLLNKCLHIYIYIYIYIYQCKAKMYIYQIFNAYSNQNWKSTVFHKIYCFCISIAWHSIIKYWSSPSLLLQPNTLDWSNDYLNQENKRQGLQRHAETFLDQTQCFETQP